MSLSAWTYMRMIVKHSKAWTRDPSRSLPLFCGRTWALAPQDTQGITWLELCLLFFLHGGSHQDLHVQGNSSAKPGASLRTVLQAFKNKAKFVLKMCLQPASNVFFKPSTCPHNRCRALGYTNHTPCIGGIPVVTYEEGQYMAQCLIELRHVFSKNSRGLLSQGLLQLSARKFSLRGVIPDTWKSKFSVFEEIREQHVDKWLVQVAGTSAPPDTIIPSLVLTCPVCCKPRECNHTKLIKGSSWQPVACKQLQCKAVRASSKWSCVCGNLWYTCPVHAPIGHTAGRQATLATASECKSGGNIQNAPKPSPDPPQAGVGVSQDRAKRRRVSDTHASAQNLPKLSLDRLQAGAGVLCNKAKRKQNPSVFDDVQRPKRRCHKHINQEAILAIQRLREARKQSRDPGDLRI